MKPSFFIINFSWDSLDKIYWKRLWLCVFAAAGAWAVLAVVIPARFHTVTSAILGAVTVGLGIMIRGNKYIKDRNDIPQVPGVPI